MRSCEKRKREENTKNRYETKDNGRKEIKRWRMGNRNEEKIKNKLKRKGGEL